MKYRHSFHAGNFADVHKHVALCALLRAMQRKDKGFFYFETHAGAGRYDLDSPDSHRGAEARHGVDALLASVSQLQAQELRDYCEAVGALRATLQTPRAYPGSPWLAARQLRAQDRGLCCELLPAECRSLERALGGMRRMRIACIDGYEQLAAALPPPERRCLLLIDPPYEHPVTELQQALQAVGLILGRLANAVIAVWYPIKDDRTLVPWLGRIERTLTVPALSLELWVYPRDSRVGLNGSGLLLINPPYRFQERAAQWQHELQQVLDPAGRGGSAVRTLTQPSAAREAGA